MLILGDKDTEAGTAGIRSREQDDLPAIELRAFLSKV
jgi:hypothetical protein